MRQPDPLQRVLRPYYRKKMLEARLLNEEELARPALVFAPHPDDETLACGGTILRKRQAGAEIKIVFLTDGSASHQQCLPPALLREVRQEEAKTAAQRLGLSADDLFFLDYADGHLSEYPAEAKERVITLLKRFQPEEIFIPYRAEPPQDHATTHQIILAALKSYPRGVIINEYPVWYWYHWPWVGVRQGKREDTLGVIFLSLRTALAAQMPRLFSTAVDIGPVLESKREALAAHRSQMTPLLPGRYWPTLSGVSDGEFLDCFFQSREYFFRYSYS